LVRDLATTEAGCRIAISADNCSVALNRITVHRDVYYVGADEGSSQFQAGTGPPLQLADNEYFMLGDNSARTRLAFFSRRAGDRLYRRGPLDLLAQRALARAEIGRLLRIAG
jgi:hypothetical protein